MEIIYYSVFTLITIFISVLVIYVIGRIMAQAFFRTFEDFLNRKKEHDDETENEQNTENK